MYKTIWMRSPQAFKLILNIVSLAVQLSFCQIEYHRWNKNSKIFLKPFKLSCETRLFPLEWTHNLATRNRWHYSYITELYLKKYSVVTSEKLLKINILWKIDRHLDFTQILHLCICVLEYTIIIFNILLNISYLVSCLYSMTVGIMETGKI